LKAGLLAACLVLSTVPGPALATAAGDAAAAGATPTTASTALAMVETRWLRDDPLRDDPRLQLASAKALALPSVSGLPWRSGSGCHKSDFDNWRGRRSDVYTLWAAQESWPRMVESIGWYRKYASMPGRLSLGLPMLTKDTRGRFDLCNSGAFDSYLRQIGQRLQSSGLGDTVIRLGWEMNHSSFPWAVPPTQKAAYKTCFQRQANILRSQAPNLLIEWNPKKGNSFGYDIRDIYPGSSHVDIIGVDYYDGWPAIHSQADWNKQLNATKYGGPYGPGAWLAFAKGQGKPLAVPEWGVCRGCNDPKSTDNPFFIQKMHEFFQQNASHIAYETYFNCNTKYNGARYRLYPTDENPRAADMYRSRW
jgi:hypothetical protein